ncbi:unnamed protein product, partial [Prorocentrum cordatum]
VLPRVPAAAFGPGVGHSLQLPPFYVRQYEALSPRWEAVRRRSLSAVILPSHRPPRRSRRRRPAPGPGSYSAEDGALRCLRADRLVTRWILPRRGRGLGEHERGLYTARPVDPSVRGDPRRLAAAEDDLAVRRRRPSALMRAPSAPPELRRSWAAGDGWRFYDQPPKPQPEGLGTFARRIEFEDFPLWEQRWSALE